MSDDVLDMEARRWAAVIAGDVETLDALIHPSLSYTHSNAMVDTKDIFLEHLTTGRIDYQGVEREDTAVITSGDCAVITGKATINVHARGNDLTLYCRYSSVWVREAGRWQFFAWQNTPIPG